ncbi:MAG TPA: glucose-1-phosphate thymidylyltransferase [Thermoplasmata archaeon]|nr:glucose-1-phosphate thymidylyltransferase [Thermoplasmata archaeon]
MKGLLLAGGHGTRLRPLTFTGNKHMIPIANQPMLYYGLRQMKEAGIEEVGIILGPITEGIREAVGDGAAFGLRVTYLIQGEPKGLAHAVLVAREFLGDEPFLMYLGDNLLEDGPKPYVEAFRDGAPAAVVGATPVHEPSHYGVIELDADGRILSIEEKPARPRSRLALVGVYLFSPEVHAVIAGLTPSSRGELEITDAIRTLNERTHRVRVIRLSGWWKDTGQVADILEANERVLATRPTSFFEIEGTVEPGAKIFGHVGVGAGSVIEKGATVRGPTVIGANVRVGEGAYVGPFVAIGDGSVVRRAEVDRSILMEEVHLDIPTRVVDSIIGRGTRLVERAEKPRGQSFVLGDSSQVSL